MDPESRIGSLLGGKYRLEKLLGTGGMGAVYEGLHEGVRKRFAIKVLRGEAFLDEGSRARFGKEAQAAAKIEHPNVVAVFDVGETEDSAPFMVMDLLRGRSLFEALESGPMAIGDAVDIAYEMLSALECAHRAGIVHRDIKPANVFLEERADGTTQVKLLDFGVAKFAETDDVSLTQSGAIVGTPLYMAPEQFLADREVDGRADVWAVGATLFQMLTDRPVHLTTSATAAAAKVVSEPAPRVRSIREDVDEELDAIVAKALAIQRDLRFESAKHMMQALDRHRVGASETLPGTLSTPRVSSMRGSTPSSDRLHEDERSGIVSKATPVEKPASSFGKHALLGLASGVAGALVTVVLVLQRPDPAGIPASPLPPLPTAPDVSKIAVDPPRDPEPAPSVSSAPSVAPVTTKIRTLPTTSPSSKAKCEDGQVESRGHCCPRGLVWQAEHCERPLATDF